MKILNFGSLNLDEVYQVEHMVMPGETLTSKAFNRFCGGKGLNQSIALAKAGAEVYHAGQIGTDGGVLLEALKSEGVDVSRVKLADTPTGRAIIQVDKNGQNCILLYGGANRTLEKTYIDQVLEEFEEGDFLLLQNEINHLSYIVEQAYQRGMRIVLNPSPFDENLVSCDFEKLYLLILNEVEGEQLTGREAPREILQELRRRYPRLKTVLTLGSRGSVYQDENLQHFQKIFKVPVVDTTAAGDTFTGYFIASILEGTDVVTGLETAAKASALAVTAEGAAPSIPLREQVRAAQLAT